MQSPESLLKKYFGYDNFRKGQREVVQALLEKKDILAIMPTGAGKSICFQIPSLLMPYGVVVISPLISLMKDQVEALKEQGIEAAYVNSTISFDESIECLRDVYRGKIKILYMAPEKLEPSYFTDCLSQVPLSMVVIDEAHCVSQWGHDFRPSYRKIREFIDSLTVKPIVSAFTATATPLVEADIKKSLGLEQAMLLRIGLDRPNLSFRVFRGLPKEKQNQLLLKYVKMHSRESGIIYCATRKAVDSIYELLKQQGVSVGKYHAGLADEERYNSQDDFSYERKMVMVATNAFGMGIDKSNVRYVIHYQMPKSLEAYYQEAGRAGRDGAKAECILFYNAKDVGIHKYLLSQSDLSEEQKQIEYRRLHKMIAYCGTTSCLRNTILTYFGEKPTQVCNHCSSCETMHSERDITDLATLIFRTIRNVGESFGSSVIADILKGSRSQYILSHQLNKQLTYGKLSFEKTNSIRSILHTLIADGYLQQVGEPYPIVQLTNKAEHVLLGKAKVKGLAPGVDAMIAKQTVIDFYKPLSHDRLYEKLLQLRSTIAQREHVPPFVIFSDATLEEMATEVPTSFQQLGKINGVGDFKLQKYGRPFLKVLKEDFALKKLEKLNQKQENKKQEVQKEWIYKYLSSIRLSCSRQQGIEPFRVFSNRTLEEMAEYIPKNKTEMMNIYGVGPVKWEKYGNIFLSAIQDVLHKIKIPRI